MDLFITSSRKNKHSSSYEVHIIDEEYIKPQIYLSAIEKDKISLYARVINDEKKESYNITIKLNRSDIEEIDKNMKIMLADEIV